jgi:hypothetical protein
MRVGLLGFALALVTTAFAAATPAFASTQNLSGTVTTSITQSTAGAFTDDSATNASNITGASDTTLLTLTHGSGNLVATWTINASLGSGLTDIGVSFTIYVDSTSNMGIERLTGVTFTDSSGNTATMSWTASTGLDLTPTGALSIATTLSAYSVTNISGSFNKANVNAVSFTFTVGASGNKTFSLDAVDVVDTPEPSAIALFGLGLAGLGGGLLRRRRARRAASSAPPAA